MHTGDFAKQVALKCGVRKSVAAKVIRAALLEMERIVIQGEPVVIKDYGKFDLKFIKGGLRNHPKGGPRVRKGDSATIRYTPAGKVKKRMATWVQQHGNPLEN